jgi:hypothetical protein
MNHTTSENTMLFAQKHDAIHYSHDNLTQCILRAPFNYTLFIVYRLLEDLGLKDMAQVSRSNPL